MTGLSRGKDRMRLLYPVLPAWNGPDMGAAFCLLPCSGQSKVLEVSYDTKKKGSAAFVPGRFFGLRFFLSAVFSRSWQQRRRRV
jgi:hypothetical protein